MALRIDVPGWDNRIKPGEDNPARLTIGCLDAIERIELALSVPRDKGDVIKLSFQDQQAVLLAYKIARDKLRKLPVAKRVVLNHEFAKIKGYLARYGAHDDDCAARFSLPARHVVNAEGPGPCTCGWSKIKETL